MNACPTCKDRVVGWEIRQARSIPVQEKTESQEGVAVANSTGSKELGSKGVADPKAFAEELAADIEEGENYSDEEDNRNKGLVHYCDDVTFSKGGVRSLSVLHPERAGEAVHLSTEEEQLTGATSRREVATPPSSSNPIMGGEFLTASAKKKPSKEGEDDNLNQTRIVKRTMNEILGLGCSDEPPKKKPGRPRSVTKKQSLDALT